MERLVDRRIWPPNNGGWQWSASSRHWTPNRYAFFNPYNPGDSLRLPRAPYIRRWLPEAGPAVATADRLSGQTIAPLENGSVTRRRSW